MGGCVSLASWFGVGIELRHNFEVVLSPFQPAATRTPVLTDLLFYGIPRRAVACRDEFVPAMQLFGGRGLCILFRIAMPLIVVVNALREPVGQLANLTARLWIRLTRRLDGQVENLSVDRRVGSQIGLLICSLDRRDPPAKGISHHLQRGWTLGENLELGGRLADEHLHAADRAAARSLASLMSSVFSGL